MLPLTERLLKEFPEPPGLRDVERWIGSDKLLLAWLRRSKRLPQLNTSFLPEVMLPAVAAIRAWKLPEIPSIGQLAKWLEITPGELDWLADIFSWERCRTHVSSRNYRYRWLMRTGKPPRLIECPKPRLRGLQRKILREILDRIPQHRAAHGFRKGRSIATFVEPHLGRALVCRIDLRNYFAQIRRPRVAALFQTLGYPESVAKTLAGLTTNAVPEDVLASVGSLMSIDRQCEARLTFSTPHLPQGAPTSPALANLTSFRLDCRLDGLLQVAGGQYTRYADDLVFSGDVKFARSWSRLKPTILAIVLDEGFHIRERKTKTMSFSQQQRVAGLVINEAIHLPRNEFDELKACLFNCVRFGPATQNHAGHANFQAQLMGRISYFRQFQPDRADKLQRLMDRIDWNQ